MSLDKDLMGCIYTLISDELRLQKYPCFIGPRGLTLVLWMMHIRGTDDDL